MHLFGKTVYRKGQIAFEFLMIYTLFMVLFIASIYFASQKAIFQQIYAEQIYAREIGMRFSQEIDTASRFPGYEKLYIFSNTIKGSGYNLNISEGVLTLSYIGQVDFYYPLMTKNITINGDSTAAPGKSINTSKGFMNITNVKGKIQINQ